MGFDPHVRPDASVSVSESPRLSQYGQVYDGGSFESPRRVRMVLSLS